MLQLSLWAICGVRWRHYIYHIYGYCVTTPFCGSRKICRYLSAFFLVTSVTFCGSQRISKQAWQNSSVSGQTCQIMFLLCVGKRATLHPKVVVTGVGNIWRARGARAYNGGLGAEPPAGSRGRAPSAKPPWRWKIWAKQRQNLYINFPQKKECV